MPWSKDLPIDCYSKRKRHFILRLSDLTLILKENVMEKIKRIHSDFMKFRGNMHNIWEECAYLDEMIRNSEKREFVVVSLHSDSRKTKRIKDAGGMQNKFLSGENTKKHFIDAIGLFESYISWLAQFVFCDYPYRMHTSGMNEEKIFNVILQKETKEEIIECLAEEKVRSVFYGKPSDVFMKDKFDLGIGKTFVNNYNKEIELYEEINGRRNAIIHNLGCVDKKYLRENPNTVYKEGQKIIISEQYLRGTIALLEGIAAKTTECVVMNIYKGSIQGKLAQTLKSFERCCKSDWYESLLK